MGSPWSFFFSSAQPTELPDIYPIPISQAVFVKIDVQNIYTRILMDVLERTDGIPEKDQKLLWDNCVAGEAQDGIVTMLAKAMVDMADLFLVEDAGVIRKATPAEEQQIRDDYKKSAESKVGIFITFKNYKRTEMIKFYSALEHCSVGGLYKSMNLSKAVQLKFNEMRSSTGLKDSGDIEVQALAIATGLAEGKDVMLDAKDIIETAKPDLTANNAAMEFISSKQSFYLGLPASWITGLTSSGLSDSGKSDSRSVERGLKPYYFSIIKPVIDQLFGAKTSFKTEDFDMLSTANETLKTFELTGDELISKENKQKTINKLYGLPEDSVGDAPPKVEPVVTPPVVVPAKPPVQ